MFVNLTRSKIKITQSDSLSFSLVFQLLLQASYGFLGMLCSLFTKRLGINIEVEHVESRVNLD